MHGPNGRRARLRVHSLESRVTPAVTTNLLNGVLTVLGDNVANNLAVNLSGSNLVVAATGQSFPSSAVNTIVLDGGQGNDTLTIGGGISQAAWIHCGAGDDIVTASGSGADKIFGGNGNDTLNSGQGNDIIYGGAGTDAIADNQGTNSLNQGSAYQTASLDAIANQIVALVNQQRAANGLPALSINPVLTFAAQSHSNQMAQQSSVQGLYEAMSHTLYGVALPTMQSRITYAGYEYTAIGENIAFGYTGAADVMQGWMNSAGHRANILNSGYTEIGVSVKANADGVLYFTQEFGTPMVPSGGTPPGNTTPPPTSTPPPPPASGQTAPAAQSLVAMGAGPGGTPRVVVYSAANGAQKWAFDAYDSSFRGGVRVATADVNGDGFEDIITAPGPGGGPHIKVFNSVTGALIYSFYAYGASFTGGVFVAGGDVNGDGKADIITAAGAGGGPHVRVFSGANGAELTGFYAYPAGFAGGVSVAAGDVDGDGKADIVTGAGPGGGPLVRVFKGGTWANIRTFYAYAPSFTGGVTVAAGDTNGDGKADIITGAGRGGGPHVQIFSGANLAVLKSFYAYSATFACGLCVSCADQNGDGRADVIVGGGAGAASPALAFNGVSLYQIRSYAPFGGGFLGGCYVG